MALQAILCTLVATLQTFLLPPSTGTRTGPGELKVLRIKVPCNVAGEGGGRGPAVSVIVEVEAKHANKIVPRLLSGLRGESPSAVGEKWQTTDEPPITLSDYLNGRQATAESFSPDFLMPPLPVSSLSVFDYAEPVSHGDDPDEDRTVSAAYSLGAGTWLDRVLVSPDMRIFGFLNQREMLGGKRGDEELIQKALKDFLELARGPRASAIRWSSPSWAGKHEAPSPCQGIHLPLPVQLDTEASSFPTSAMRELMEEAVRSLLMMARPPRPSPWRFGQRPCDEELFFRSDVFAQ